ncbi:MAG: type II toxin-antitoxin system VapC family toxin [Betaproteobacteria bacterium]|nr:type II toxin-antitoxin system VapC family toxin [Betaproteobacteria bacterium]
MPVLVDTNVLLDIATEDPLWLDWSASRLSQAANRDGVAINPIVYAELSVHYETIEALEAGLSGYPFERLALPWDAAFVAGKAYRRYRGRGGAKRSPLPDFYIGAHAAVSGLTLLTRDAKRYRDYFPKLRLIAPV